MKRFVLLSSIICFALLSCQKQNSINTIQASLNGTWKMIIVKDNLSGAAITKPTSIQGEVDITFTTINPTSGVFTGNTPNNTIMENNFSTGTNQTIMIPVLSMTKVMETSWGNEFVANIRNSQEYSFDADDRLTIKTAAKSLLFEKH